MLRLKKMFMKKLCFLVLVLFVGQTVLAQDINQLIAELSKVEGVVHQLIDKEMFKVQMEQMKENDPDEEILSQIPPFMAKMENTEVIVLESCTEDIRDKVETVLSGVNADEGYETLMAVNEADNKVKIISKKNDLLTDLYVVVNAAGTVVLVKVSGDFNDQDIQDFLSNHMNNNDYSSF